MSDQSPDLPKASVPETQEALPGRNPGITERIFRADQDRRVFADKFRLLWEDSEKLASLLKDRLPDDYHVFRLEDSNGRWVKVAPPYRSPYAFVEFTDSLNPNRLVTLDSGRELNVYRLDLENPDDPVVNIVSPSDAEFRVNKLEDRDLERDPLDAAREGLDHFLQNAGELKLVQPSEAGGETPPTPPAPTAPPTQPAPSS